MKKTISITTIMKILCILSMLGILVVYDNVGATQYINQSTIWISSVLTAIVYLIIVDYKRNNNPLLLVLAWWTIFFILIRVITLNYTDFSVCLSRSGANSSTINKSLIYIILGTIVLWWSIRIHGKINDGRGNLTVNYKPTYVKNALIIYWIAFFINVIAEYSLPLAGLASIIRNFILNIFDLLYLLVAYLILVWNKLSKKDKTVTLISLLAFFVFVTLGGSRSGLFSIAKMLFFICLVLGFIKFKRVYLYIIVAIAPLFLFFFLFSTYLRQMNMWDAPTREKIEASSAMMEKSKGLETRVLLGPVFDRIGFLDYATEMVTKKDHFRKIVNISSELKSVVDNAISPGFDIFDAPKISNMISNSYEFGESVVLSKTANSEEDYHSDELTIFGESYLLFGVPLFLVFLFFAGCYFGFLYKKYSKIRNETGVFLMSICVYLFEVFLSSYGLDWLVLNIVCFLLTYFIFKGFVFRRNIKNRTALVVNC